MSFSPVNEIRKAFVKGIVDKGIDNLYVALGTGNANWGVEQSFTGSFNANPDNTLSLGTSEDIKNVVVKSSDEATTFTEGSDYTVDLTTGLVTRITSGIIADEAPVSITYFFDDSVKLTKTGLVNPLGLKKISQVEFLVNDGGGTVINSTGSFSVSPDPTNILLIRGSFLSSEYSGQTIREFGVFLESDVLSGQPPLHFYPPGEITDYGIPLMFENTPQIVVGDINKEWTLIV
jgi:hypothetical protein